jgi:hypothetical protein
MTVKGRPSRVLQGYRLSIGAVLVDGYYLPEHVIPDDVSGQVQVCEHCETSLPAQ